MELKSTKQEDNRPQNVVCFALFELQDGMASTILATSRRVDSNGSASLRAVTKRPRSTSPNRAIRANGSRLCRKFYCWQTTPLGNGFRLLALAFRR